MGRARVVRVERIENRAVWRGYAQLREVFETAGSAGRLLRPTAQASGSQPIRCDRAEAERFLFHGTKPEAVERISREGFKIPAARGVARARFGNGVYSHGP